MPVLVTHPPHFSTVSLWPTALAVINVIFVDVDFVVLTLSADGLD